MFISSTQNVRITPTGDQLSVGMSPLYTTVENKGVIICAYTAPLSYTFEAHLHEMETDNIIETHILFNWLIPNCGIIIEWCHEPNVCNYYEVPNWGWRTRLESDFTTASPPCVTIHERGRSYIPEMVRNMFAADTLADISPSTATWYAAYVCN